MERATFDLFLIQNCSLGQSDKKNFRPKYDVMTDAIRNDNNSLKQTFIFKYIVFI